MINVIKELVGKNVLKIISRRTEEICGICPKLTVMASERDSFMCCLYYEPPTKVNGWLWTCVRFQCSQEAFTYLQLIKSH